MNGKKEYDFAGVPVKLAHNWLRLCTEPPLPSLFEVYTVSVVVTKLAQGYTINKVINLPHDQISSDWEDKSVKDAFMPTKIVRPSQIRTLFSTFFYMLQIRILSGCNVIIAFKWRFFFLLLNISINELAYTKMSRKQKLLFFND